MCVLVVPFQATASHAGHAWMREEGRSMPQGPQPGVTSNHPEGARFLGATPATHAPGCESGAAALHSRVVPV